MGKLAQKALDYYDGPAAGALTPQTRIYRGMALVRMGGAAAGSRQRPTTGSARREARTIFEQLRADGNDSEAVTLGLRAGAVHAVLDLGAGRRRTRSRPTCRRPPSCCDRWSESAEGSPRGQHALRRRAQLPEPRPAEEARRSRPARKRAPCWRVAAQRPRRPERRLDLRRRHDSQARHTLALGRLEAPPRSSCEVYEIAETVLAKRPGDLRSMRTARWPPTCSVGSLYGVTTTRPPDFAHAEPSAGGRGLRALQSRRTLHAGSTGSAASRTATVLYEQGRVRDALAELESNVVLDRR